jgi:hypothetical protein
MLSQLSGSGVSLPDNVWHSLLYTFKTDPNLKEFQFLVTELLEANPHTKKSQIFNPFMLSEGVDMAAVFNGVAPTNESGPMLSSICSLSQLVSELGPSSFVSVETLVGVIRKYHSLVGSEVLTANDIAELLGLVIKCSDISNNSAEDISMVNAFRGVSSHSGKAEVDVSSPPEYFKVLLHALREFPAAYSWPDVIKALDYPSFRCPSADGLRFIILFYSNCTREPFPYEMLISPWENSAGQLSILVAAINTTVGKGQAPMSFANMGPRARIFGGLTINLSSIQEPWTRIKFVETLFRLAESESYALVRKLFEIPIMDCPDVLVLTLTESSDQFPLLRHELLSLLLPYYMSPASCNYPILNRFVSCICFFMVPKILGIF